MTDDQEATWRALKGDDQIAPLRCRLFHWHRWTAWKRDEIEKDYAYLKTRMIRHCADCNDVDSVLRKFKTG